MCPPEVLNRLEELYQEHFGVDEGWICLRFRTLWMVLRGTELREVLKLLLENWDTIRSPPGSQWELDDARRCFNHHFKSADRIWVYGLPDKLAEGVETIQFAGGDHRTRFVPSDTIYNRKNQLSTLAGETFDSINDNDNDDNNDDNNDDDDHHERYRHRYSPREHYIGALMESFELEKQPDTKTSDRDDRSESEEKSDKFKKLVECWFFFGTVNHEVYTRVLGKFQGAYSIVRGLAISY